MEIITGSKNINFSDWEEFLQNHPNGYFFQSPGLVNFYNQLDNYEVKSIFALQNEAIVGVLIGVEQKEGSGVKGYLTNRCIIFGGPIISENIDQETVAHQLLETLKRESSAIYIEFRNLFSLSRFDRIFNAAGFENISHVNFLVNTDLTPDEALMNLSSSKRRQVRKSIKTGAVIREPQSIDDVRSFYEILLDLYQNKVKKPLPEWEFFKEFYENENLGKYFIIKYNEEVMGGIMCPIYKDTIYEWYIAGLDGEIKHVYPSVLATWAPIEYAVKYGLKYFDFLGAGHPNKDYGVREFKSKFGGELVEFGRYKYINKPLLYKLGEIGLKVYQKVV